MYSLKVKPNLDRILNKLSKKNHKQYEIIKNKVEEILENPQHYKNLKGPLKGWKEVHIDKSFVLTFSVDENTKTVTLEDYDHHDKIFRK